MSLFIASLNSGSNGNCYYVGNESEAILIDAGISCREIEKRMKRLGLHIQKLKAVFISHEHADHIRGITVLSKKYALPVYITAATLMQSRLSLDDKMTLKFKAYEPTDIGNLSVTPFPKLHDACDPYSFIISCNKVNVGVFTDIGSPCENLIHHFKKCHAAFLETNYDEVMLDTGNYPYHLKKRIKGGMGHLSNNQALEIFLKYKPSFMSYLVLSHLSKHNNTPQLVQELFNLHAGEVQMVVASREQETLVYHIRNTYSARNKIRTLSVSSQQLKFSFY